MPNLAAIGSLVAEGALDQARLPASFRGRRYGELGADEANADAWLPEELEASLARVGFVAEEIEAGPMITVSARRGAVVSRQAATPVLPWNRCDCQRRLRRPPHPVAGAVFDRVRGLIFETVVLVNGPGRRVTGALRGPGRRRHHCCQSPQPRQPGCCRRGGPARPLRDRRRRLRPRRRLTARLVAVSDPSIGLSCAAVVDEGGLVVHAGFDLVGDAATPRLGTLARSAYLRAETALSEQADVDAVGATGSKERVHQGAKRADGINARLARAAQHKDLDGAKLAQSYIEVKILVERGDGRMQGTLQLFIAQAGNGQGPNGRNENLPVAIDGDARIQVDLSPNVNRPDKCEKRLYGRLEP